MTAQCYHRTKPKQRRPDDRGTRSGRSRAREGVVPAALGACAGGRFCRRAPALCCGHDRLRYLREFHHRSRGGRARAMAQRLAGYFGLPFPHGRYPRDRLLRPALCDRHGRLRFDRLPRGRHALRAPRPHDRGVVAPPDRRGLGRRPHAYVAVPRRAEPVLREEAGRLSKALRRRFAFAAGLARKAPRRGGASPQSLRTLRKGGVMTVRLGLRGLTIGAALAFGFTAPAMADGLSQFEKLLKPQIPPGALTYKSAKALGDNGFVLEDLTLTDNSDGADKNKPVPVKKITVEEFDFTGFEKDQAPTFLKAKVEGIVIDAKPTESVDLKEMAGLDHVNGDFLIDYRLDAKARTMSVNRVELDLEGLGRLELSLVLDGVDADSHKKDGAMDDAVLRTAKLTFEDRSILGKLVPAVAKMQGSDAGAAIALAKLMLEGVRAGQGEATQKAFDALASFLDDYKKPKGPLTVTLKPDKKFSGADLKNAA